MSGWAARAKWLLAMPAHHIAGIQVLVRSLVAGTTPVSMDLEGGFTPAAFARATAEIASGATAYTALVPTQLVRLLASADGRQALTRYAAVLVGGAATPSGLLAEARDAGVRVVTTYGMSETAGGCVYDGRALDVSLVQLEDDGRIRLGGATLAQGYLGEPALSAKAFVVDDAAGRWFRTDDVGHLDDRGALIVDGRIDDQINTGGLKVAPRQVEEALTGLDNVAEAVVVGSPDPEWGQLVSAAIVVTQGSSPPTLDEVRDRLRGILPGSRPAEAARDPARAPAARPGQAGPSRGPEALRPRPLSRDKIIHRGRFKHGKEVGMAKVLLFLVPLAMTIYAVIDAIQTEDTRVQHLPKLVWIVLILLFSPPALAPSPGTSREGSAAPLTDVEVPTTRRPRVAPTMIRSSCAICDHPPTLEVSEKVTQWPRCPSGSRALAPAPCPPPSHPFWSAPAPHTPSTGPTVPSPSLPFWSRWRCRSA